MERANITGNICDELAGYKGKETAKFSNKALFQPEEDSFFCKSKIVRVFRPRHRPSANILPSSRLSRARKVLIAYLAIAADILTRFLGAFRSNAEATEAWNSQTEPGEPVITHRRSISSK